MMWLTAQERLTLSALGALAMAALGILAWHELRAPLRLEHGPVVAPPARRDTSSVGSPATADTSSPERILPARSAVGMVPPRSPAAQWDAQIQRARRVRLNDATAEELERLPEIGPSTAKRIVDYRQAHGPFRRVEELEAVPGIGLKTLEAMRDYLTVEDE